MPTQKETLHNIYSSASREAFGSAAIVGKEFSSLRAMYRFYKTRAQVIEKIVDQGWLQPDEVAIEDLGESAVSHACVVAEHLFETRGEEASPNTYFSYTTKNQFDRYVANTLLKSNRIREGQDLYHDWYDPQDRDPSHSNPAVKYPKNIDATKIYGIAKPNRYWPAQLLRYLEAIRLNRASTEELQKLHVNQGDIKKYTIPWVNYREVIEKAQSVDEIAVGVAVKTMEILHQNGLSNEQIVEVVLAGYSPGGPVNEHGKIPQIGKIWHDILDAVYANQNLAEISPLLSQRIHEKMLEIKYPFD